LIHGVLEALDFASSDPLARRELVQHLIDDRFPGRGFSPDPICRMLEELLAVELMEGFSLSRLTPGSWLSEMEFWFPHTTLTPARLTKILQEEWREAPFDLRRLTERLEFREVHGMMTGSIDMVFEQGGRYYLIDWKTNHLGWTPDDYAQTPLRQEMERCLYPLQYLIYTVALHRHLTARLPGYDYDRHGGGVFYLFLRGIDRRSPGQGVHADRPPRTLVERLNQEMGE